MVYNGISHVVMMATPQHLEDFALGFSLSEGILQSAGELYSIEQAEHQHGIELQMDISAERFAGLKAWRRNMTGRTGCGLCGAESLQQAIRPVPSVNNTVTLSNQAIQAAVAQLEAHQPLQALTGAVHGAAWCDLQGEILLLREDVGRHNALDKLIGAMHGAGIEGRQGFVLISSRASYEMVTKAASLQSEVLVSVSAATKLAIDMAEQAGITLVGFARPQRHVVYAGAYRIEE